MSSSLHLSYPLLLPNKFPYNVPSINPSNRFTSFRISRNRQISKLISSPTSNLEASWIETNGDSNDDLGGWLVRKKPEIESRNGVQRFVLASVGASVAVVLAAFTYLSFSKKGFQFQFGAPFHSLHELFTSSNSGKVPIEGTESIVVERASVTKVDDTSDIGSHHHNRHQSPFPLKRDWLEAALHKSDIEYDLSKSQVNLVSAGGGNKHIIVSSFADPIQLEALDVLKKLKIIENDACADELCTRREYARWFVKANSMLERNPKHKIVPMILIAGSTITAFDDVSTSDPDFCCIQALGEAGIIASKLSSGKSNLSDMGNLIGRETFEFSPESFISRFDLVSWKAMLEYPFSPEAKEKMLRTKAGIMDLTASNLDSSPQLLMDLMAGDKSIVRRVFGNIRRLQPQKPVTRAQAAVALTSGRMVERIRSELSRLEAENQSRLAEMEEIRSDLIRRGEIKRIWEERINNEKERGYEVERDLQIALLELEKERMARGESVPEFMKEKAALEYHQQLLFSLREEVDDMGDRLPTERANIFAEQQSFGEVSADLRNQQDGMVEAKLILEAEKEALRILRYWVEEEARKIQSRGKVLEQATQRWKWNSGSGKLA